jgi:integrase
MLKSPTEPKPFTDRMLAALKPPKDGRLEFLDPRTPGLMLRVTPDGTKTFSVRYRPKREPQRRVTLGPYPAVKLADARAEALEIAALAKRGRDKPAEDERARLKAQRKADVPATVGDLVKRYIDERVIGDPKAPRHKKWKWTASLLRMHVVPKLGALPLADLCRGDIAALLDGLLLKKAARGEKRRLTGQVNRVKSQLTTMLRWAAERMWIDSNPAREVSRRYEEKPRERVLTGEDLRAIWNAAVKLGYPSGHFVRALMLSGQRRAEVQNMEWRELIDDGAAWLLPAARNKSKRDHLLPLSADLRALIASCPKRTIRPEDQPYVFSHGGRDPKPYHAEVRLKVILDRMVAEAGTPVADWVFHDLRRTAATRMSEIGIPEDVIARVLNHSRKSITGRVYDRNKFGPEKRHALEAWAQELARIVAGDGGGNVVTLKRA